MRLREAPVRRPLGAVPLDDGLAELRVWAPNARSVAVRLRGDPFIADGTREGRKREFAGFAGFSADDIPDPQDPQAFERSKLSHEGDDDLRAFYAELLRLRRELPRDVETTVDGATLRVRRGDVELVADLEHLTVELRR